MFQSFYVKDAYLIEFLVLFKHLYLSGPWTRCRSKNKHPKDMNMYYIFIQTLKYKEIGYGPQFGLSKDIVLIIH